MRAPQTKRGEALVRCRQHAASLWTAWRDSWDGMPRNEQYTREYNALETISKSIHCGIDEERRKRTVGYRPPT